MSITKAQKSEEPEAEASGAQAQPTGQGSTVPLRPTVPAADGRDGCDDLFARSNGTQPNGVVGKDGPIAPCISCGEPCSYRDPAGRFLHAGCPDPAEPKEVRRARRVY